MGGYPFGKSDMARCALFLAPLIKKAKLRSGGDVSAARARLLAYSRRSPGVQREMVRKAIGQAEFTCAPPAAVIPAERDIRPFTADQVCDMGARVQVAADRALNAATGEIVFARELLWLAALGEPELAEAIAGLLILAL